MGHQNHDENRYITSQRQRDGRTYDGRATRRRCGYSHGQFAPHCQRAIYDRDGYNDVVTWSGLIKQMRADVD